MAEQGSSTAASGSQAVSREEFQRFFSAIDDMKGQLTNLKRDLSQERSEADERLVKRLKADKKTVFKKKGNERQYAFNARRFTGPYAWRRRACLRTWRERVSPSRKVRAL